MHHPPKSNHQSYPPESSPEPTHASPGTRQPLRLSGLEIAGYCLHLLVPALAVPMLGILLARAWRLSPDPRALFLGGMGTGAVYLLDRLLEPPAPSPEAAPPGWNTSQPSGEREIAPPGWNTSQPSGEREIESAEWRQPNDPASRRYLPAGLRRISWCLAAGFSFAAFCLAISSFWRSWKAYLVMGASLGLHRATKAWPAGKTLPVALCWTVGAVVLPFPGVSGRWELLWRPASLAVFLLVAAGCLLCDCKDLERDAASGKRNLSVLLGFRRTLLLAEGLAMAALPLAWLGSAPLLSVTILGYLGLYFWPAGLADGFWGALLTDAFLALPGLIAWG